jgi:hypothetical protein
VEEWPSVAPAGGFSLDSVFGVGSNPVAPTAMRPQCGDAKTPTIRVRSFPASLSDSAQHGTSSIDEPALESSIEHISPAEAARAEARLRELMLNENASKL